MNNDPALARRLRQILFGLVLLLTFEGIARKMAPSELRVPLFLLKDVFVVVLGFYVAKMRMSDTLNLLWKSYMFLIFLMLPPILMTAYHDPLLALFGIKQYLLYPIVGFATFMAFEKAPMETILRFFRWISLLIIPTAGMALLQSRLPADNWINMSVNGENLKGFAAGGELRVSSTFSFVAQYCAFLNAQMFIVWIALQGWGRRSFFWKIVIPALIPLIVFSSFITGSRAAVVGNLSIILLAAVFIGLRFQMNKLFHIGATMLVLYLAAVAVHYFSPSATAAYSAREDGKLLGFSSEIKQRVYDSYFNLAKDRYMHTFMGNGLGIMSNGSDTFSEYAATWRMRTWTEADFSTTLFEGGYYLVFIWYAFRVFVVFKCLACFFTDVTEEFSVSMSFCMGFVTISGILGTLALQPPIAIWWWFGVGTLLLFAWKSIAPPESEEKPEEPRPRGPIRKPRGRSLYADVIHGDQ